MANIEQLYQSWRNQKRSTFPLPGRLHSLPLLATGSALPSICLKTFPAEILEHIFTLVCASEHGLLRTPRMFLLIEDSFEDKIFSG